MMRDWISVEDRLPELTETMLITELEVPTSKDVIVAEYVKYLSPPAKVEFEEYEEDVGRLLRSGWMSNCQNITHWSDSSFFVCDACGEIIAIPKCDIPKDANELYCMECFRKLV